MSIVTGDITGRQYEDDIPSQRIRFALEAMQWFENTDGYGINMKSFREESNGLCIACSGGAARTRKDGIFASEHEADVNTYEESLDHARTGTIGVMFEEMELNYHVGKPFDRNITPYNLNRDQFYQDMIRLADDLEAAGY